jgi:hypothetical protein
MGSFNFFKAINLLYLVLNYGIYVCVLDKYRLFLMIIEPICFMILVDIFFTHDLF